MRIFLAGATGVLGRALIANLGDHEVVGLTRHPDRVEFLESLGAEALVGDVYDRDHLLRMVANAQVEVVVNFLTDLTDGDLAANDRIRRDAGPILIAAAQSAGVRRLAVESVAFPLEGASAQALAPFEQGALSSGLETLVLRFGRLWGAGTWYEEPPEPPRVHVEEAGARAAELITAGTPGVHVVA